MRSLFVAMHKPRIASDVSGQYRRQPPLDPDWPLLHHWPAIQPTAYCTTDRTTAKRVLTGCPPKLMSVIGTGCVKTPSMIRFLCDLAGGFDDALCRWL